MPITSLNQLIRNNISQAQAGDNKNAVKAGGNKVDYVGKTQRVFDGIVKNLKFLGADGQILTAGKSGKIPPGQVSGTGNISEAVRYFYHPDHLGNTSYITDVTGEVYQHLEYFAFGETFVEEHSNTDRTPYLFSGKELDEETGLYYYGARYYDPRVSVFISIDPLAEKFPDLSPYNFAQNNPIRFNDPDGMAPSEGGPQPPRPMRAPTRINLNRYNRTLPPGNTPNQGNGHKPGLKFVEYITPSGRRVGTMQEYFRSQQSELESYSAGSVTAKPGLSNLAKINIAAVSLAGQVLEFYEQVNRAKSEGSANTESHSTTVIVDIATYQKLTKLQSEYNSLIMERARNGLTPEQFNALDPDVQRQKINVAFAFAPPSPETVFLQALKKGKKEGDFAVKNEVSVSDNSTISQDPNKY